MGRRYLQAAAFAGGFAGFVTSAHIKGLTESLTGRFENSILTHWSYAEMKKAFGTSLNSMFYGGYPGAASLIGKPDRWRNYLRNSLIETTITRDILLMTRIDKPALLRQLFELACRFSGQILSFSKMLGQLHDAGNTTTLAHYLDLLAAAGMVCGLPNFPATSSAAVAPAQNCKYSIRD